MGIPFFVSFPDDVTPPAEHRDDGREKPFYVKHVVIKDTGTSIASFTRIDNFLFFQRLLSSTSNSSVLQQLIVVQFLSNDKSFITEVLNKGIECNGSQYHYLGKSCSQLRNKTCFMIDATRNDIYRVLTEFGNFEDIFPLARRTQTIGRIFTPFSYNLNLKDDDFDVSMTSQALWVHMFSPMGVASCPLSFPTKFKSCTIYRIHLALSKLDSRISVVFLCVVTRCQT